MLPKNNRLTKPKDIQQVVRQGRSFFSQRACIKFIKNQQKLSRFAIIISLKINKKAVIRNKLRRQIHSIIEKFLPNIKSGLDIVILTRPALLNLGFQELKKEIEYLFRKTNLLN